MHPAQNYTAIETYNFLMQEEIGKKHDSEADLKKAKDMRDFLNIHFGTTRIQNVDIAALKEKLEGPTLVKRTQYRKEANKALRGHREVVQKGQILRRENLHASMVEAELRNPTVGFYCLHYSVSEGSGYLLVKI